LIIVILQFQQPLKSSLSVFVTCSVDPQTAIFSTMKQSQTTTLEILTYSS